MRTLRVRGWLIVAALIVQPYLLIRNVGSSDMKNKLSWLSQDYGVL
jgi:Ni/Fe-hydrogenase subunit HybB-like protein